MIERPVNNEYEAYYHQYISKVPEGDVLEIMETNIRDTVSLLAGIGEDKAGYWYAPGKWSIKQVVGHLADVERLFGYRTMAFARRDKTPLPSFDQNEYVEHANFDNRSLRNIAGEFECIRRSNVALFRSFDPDILMRTGLASGFSFTVRSVAFIIAGHEIHHVGVLKERYL